MNNDDRFRYRGMQSIYECAAEQLGATSADIPGLWNVPGHGELTQNQLLDLASKSQKSEFRLSQRRNEG